MIQIDGLRMAVFEASTRAEHTAQQVQRVRRAIWCIVKIGGLSLVSWGAFQARMQDFLVRRVCNVVRTREL